MQRWQLFSIRCLTMSWWFLNVFALFVFIVNQCSEKNHYWFINRRRNRYLTKDGKLCPTVWIPLRNRRTTSSSWPSPSRIHEATKMTLKVISMSFLGLKLLKNAFKSKFLVCVVHLFFLEFIPFLLWDILTISFENFLARSVRNHHLKVQSSLLFQIQLSLWPFAAENRKALDDHQSSLTAESYAFWTHRQCGTIWLKTT